MSDAKPINLFSHRIDPRGVLAVLRSLGTVKVVGPDDDWTEATLFGPKRFLRRTPSLVFGHHREYYDGGDWPLQVMGMANYFSGFPDVPRKAEILQSIRAFRFALSLPQMDLDIESDDPRRAWLFAVCRHLDGLLFTPSALRDANGRVLIAANGEYDANAQLPTARISQDSAPDVDNDDVDEEPEPPTAERVARRALVLAAVTNRGLIENERDSIADAEGARQRMLDLIKTLDLDDEVEPEEWKALQRPVGKLDAQATINACWRLEGLGVLLWSLKKYELPAYDQLVTPADLYEAAGLTDMEVAGEFLAHASLRTTEELEEYSKQALALHWRLRDFSLRPQAMDFVAFSKNCWFGSFDLAHFRVLENDLAIGYEPITRADAEAVATCRSAAMERHLAINWLHGYSKVYSETDTST